ncbi:MAG: dethiobiotin synthase [Bacteroidota bacterium]
MIEFPDAFFVTGTDTGIGKTVLSSMLMSALDATYWKPIQSGLEEETDTAFVQRVSGVTDQHIIPERYKLNTPMSPHASADIDGVELALNDFKLPEFSTRHLIVEGAGGLIVPINWKDTILDVIVHLGLPVLLVARSELGTLNHTLLSLKALRDRKVDVLGVVLSGESHPSNHETIEHFGQVPVFDLEPVSHLNREHLLAAYQTMTHV